MRTNRRSIGKGENHMKLSTAWGFCRIAKTGTSILAVGVIFLSVWSHLQAAEKNSEPSKNLLAELKSYPHKIVYETNRDGNWELYLVNADGSDPVNLTRTPEVDEL